MTAAQRPRASPEESGEALLRLGPVPGCPMERQLSRVQMAVKFDIRSPSMPPASPTVSRLGSPSSASGPHRLGANAGNPWQAGLPKCPEPLPRSRLPTIAPRGRIAPWPRRRSERVDRRISGRCRRLASHHEQAKAAGAGRSRWSRAGRRYRTAGLFPRHSRRRTV
jgi:hypothetical protein